MGYNILIIMNHTEESLSRVQTSTIVDKRCANKKDRDSILHRNIPLNIEIKLSLFL